VWRNNGDPSSLGGNGRYTESGLVLLANSGVQGSTYVQNSLENVRQLLGPELSKRLKELKSREEICEELGGQVDNLGDWGYVNPYAGWADAEASMLWLRKQVEETNRVQFIYGEASCLVYSGASSVRGVRLANGQELDADLTIVAAGAWSGKLVDLRGRVQASGQVLCYLPLEPSEQETLSKGKVVLNMSTGMFTIPPPMPSTGSHNYFKVARHGYGYANQVLLPIPIPTSEEDKNNIAISLPKTTWDIPNLVAPQEGQAACSSFLSALNPPLKSRDFCTSKICWYADTPTGDWIIAHHPEHPGLFVATGGSGHGFKFLPVIGDAIVDVLIGREYSTNSNEGGWFNELKTLWRFREPVMGDVVTEDGSRGGPKGMDLDEELRR
jgi:sarcosine oxidase/L-pipecolate oxidase